MPRASYESAPYLAGDKSIFRNLVLAAPNACQRIAVWGGQQENSPASWGQYLFQRLLNNGFYAFGRASETHLFHPYSNTTNFITYNSGPGTTATVEPPAYIINSNIFNSGVTPLQGSTFLLNPRCEISGGMSPVPSIANREQWLNTTDLRLQVHMRGNPAGPNFLRTRSCPVTTAAGSYLATLKEEFTSPDLGLSAMTTNQWVKYTTPQIQIDPAALFPQLILLGWNGSAQAANLSIGGGRFIEFGRDRGMTWTSFGSTVSTAGAITANMGGFYQFRTYGPWQGLVICYGLTDALNNKTADQYKADTQQMIDLFRGANWNQVDVPIILMSTQMRTTDGTFTQSMLDQLKLYPEVYNELAAENENVVSINMARYMDEAGFDPADPYWTSAGHHLFATSQDLRADTLFQVMLQQAAKQGTDTQDIADAVIAAFKADISLGAMPGDLEVLRNAVVGYNQVTDNLNGTYTITVRDATNANTLITILYNPTTGSKSIVS